MIKTIKENITLFLLFIASLFYTVGSNWLSWKCLSQDANKLCADVSVAFFSSTFLLLMLEYLRISNDVKVFGNLEGKYERIEIHGKADERQPGDTIYVPVPGYENVKMDLNLNYQGGRKYTGIAQYAEGKAKVEIQLDAINAQIGRGVYQYLEKHPQYKMPDYGTYEVQVDLTNTRRLFVYYRNIVPSGLTEGYEIWEKEG